MSQSIVSWYHSLPLITRYYLTACVLVTALSAIGFLNLKSIYLNFDLIWDKFQIWRLATSFLYLGGFSFSFLMQLMILVNYSSRLEQDPFPSGGGATADYAYMLLFGASIFWIFAFFMQLPFLGHPLIFMILYVWSRRYPNAPVSIWGFQFQGLYLPWAMIAFTVLIGGNPTMDMIGVVAGYLYYFLLQVLPDLKGWRLINTPQFLINMFPPPIAPVQQARAAASSGGYSWGSGRRLGLD